MEVNTDTLKQELAATVEAKMKAQAEYNAYFGAESVLRKLIALSQQESADNAESDNQTSIPAEGPA